MRKDGAVAEVLAPSSSLSTPENMVEGARYFEIMRMLNPKYEDTGVFYMGSERKTKCAK